MRILTFVFIFIFSQVLPAQNLVPNPGFDILTECPFDYGQIQFAQPWISASSSTPDLFNECSSGLFLQVPYAGRSLDSYQMPKSGTGYSYIEVYDNNNNASGSRGNSEYIETPLSQSLQKGVIYYLEFYVSPDFTQIRNFGFSDAVGLALSDTLYYKELRAMEALPLDPVIENRGAVIIDTVGWTRISGCYTAKGGEKYAIIGNFRSTDETLVEFENPTYPFINLFYIDDILITPFNPLPDTILLCDDAPEELNAGFLDASYLWNTGKTDSVITISHSGQYSVEVVMENCTLKDSVIVLDTRDVLSLPFDTVICQGDPIHLSLQLPGDYLWSDGTRHRDLTVSSSGHYSVTVTNECGEFTYSTAVEAKDCMCAVYVPNAFSPNADGINDFLGLDIGCDFEYRLINFSVFDRWGGHVYSLAQGDDIRWDGTSRGRLLPPGVYIWTVEYELVRNGLTERRFEKGDVTILR